MNLTLKEINASFLTQIPERKIFIVWFEGGRRKVKTTGSRIWKEAVAFHEKWKDEKKEMLRQYEAGETEKNKFKPRMFSDFGKKYLELSEPPTKTIKTYKTIQTAVNEFLRIAGDKPMHHYELEDLDTFLKRKIKETSEFSARRYKIDLKAIFNMAIKYNHLKVNLWRETMRVEPSFDGIDHFEKEEFRIFLNACDEKYKKIFTFYVLSGLRREELINQRTENILLRNNLIKVENDYSEKQEGQFRTVEFTTKNKSYRFVELNNLLIPIVKEARENNQEYLFEQIPGKKMNSQMVSKMFKRYLKKSGLEKQHLHLHDLRHTFAIWMLQLTGNMKYVSQQLGHRRMETTEKYYAKYNPEKNTGYNKLKI